jgi:Ca2+-transporting ATPase
MSRRPPRSTPSLTHRPSPPLFRSGDDGLAVIGGALLVGLPRYGFGLAESRSLLFLYMTIGQLFYVYPSRRIETTPGRNIALHLSVILGTGLQLLTVLLPGLRALLGLEQLTLSGLACVAAAVLLSWGAAETYVRFNASTRQTTV